ncbi:uncharacterized protein B0H64DRAFT_475290 [Chaetomium fimeti]|uniref:Uncharacterized protein n=1 Tax=Chaetomium fimeti TaxID=1854472 RepID=A0AAE0HH56_9PEZI|nr:hypothetical protein B0H64DRAFT_475290 [Chaetomium fimeti]
MCGWEEIIYTCDRRHSKLRRTKYSCDVYRRYVYGFCEFDERYDRRRVSQYHSSGMCDECNAIFQRRHVLVRDDYQGVTLNTTRIEEEARCFQHWA